MATQFSLLGQNYLTLIAMAIWIVNLHIYHIDFSGLQFKKRIYLKPRAFIFDLKHHLPTCRVPLLKL